MTDTQKSTPETEAVSAVFYTDGGYQRQYDVGGWGVHGYLFHEKESKTGSGMKNGMPTKVGYVTEAKLPMPITPVKYVDGIGSLTQGATNNTAELTAAIRTLDFALDYNLKDIHLFIDSQYTIKVYQEWGEKWERMNWIKSDGQPVANKTLICDLLDRKRAVVEKGTSVKITWVKGHSGNFGNERADMLATHGIIAGVNNAPIDKFFVKDAKGFWKNAVSRNRMLNLPRLLCTVNQVHPEGWHAYHMTQIRSADEFIGKRISDAQFAVVWAKEPDPVVKTIQTIHIEMAQRTGNLGPVIINLDEVVKPDVYNNLDQNGADFLLIDDVRRAVRVVKPKSDSKKEESKKEMREEDEEVTESIDTPGGTATLSRVVQPPRLTFRAMDKLESLEELLKLYMAHEDGKTVASKVKFTDITSHLYAMVEKGKNKKTEVKLLSTITTTVPFLDVEVAYATDLEEGQTKVRLTLGLDLPDRNTLSAVAGEAIKVAVVTWPESNYAIRYATVVSSSEGIGIWAAPYANLHFVKTAPKPS